MRSRWMFLFTVLLLASFILAPVAPVAAQDVLPPPPADPQRELNPALPEEGEDPALIERGLVQRDGLWAAEGNFVPEEEEIDAQATYSKADAFGYRYTKTNLNWINAYAAGTRLEGDDDRYIGLELPFMFRFYGYLTDHVYVSPYGYLTASWQNNLYSQSDLKNLTDPNDVIAPYWAPMYPGSGGGMYYLAGGVAPNRWMAIEWHNFEDPGYYNYFTFEVVLYENGEILFQYDDMSYDDYGWYCGTAGIEDRSGSVALTTLKFCNQQSAYRAIKIVPPAPSARVAFTPTASGGLAAPGGVIEHTITIENTGDKGADVYDLALKGKWPGLLYNLDGDLLTDTDGDGKIDTGLVGEGAGFSVVAKVTVPVTAKVSTRYDSTLTATSSVNKKKTKTAKLENAVAASFAQAYSKNQTVSMLLSGKEGLQQQPVLDYVYNPGVVETANGRLFHFHNLWLCTTPECDVEHYPVFFSLYEHDGSLVAENQELAPGLSDTTSVYMWDYAAAPGPFGLVGVVYTRVEDDIYNVFFTALNENGDVVIPPVNVTKNTTPAYDEYDDPWGPQFINPELALTADGHFILAWERYLYSDYGALWDIYYAILDEDGFLMEQPIMLTVDPGYSANYYSAHVNRVNGNKVLLGWTYWQRTGKPGKYKYTYYVQYMILNSWGELVYKPAAMKAGSYADGLDSAQMANGEVVLAWTGGSYPKYYIYYAVLNSSFKKSKSGTALKYSTSLSDADDVSVAADPAGYAILTWKDYFDQNLKYALLGKNGAVKTKPMNFVTVNPYEDYTDVNYNGNGNTSYGLHRPVNVTITVTVPKTTDATGKGVFLAGNFNGWDPAGTPMTRVDKTHWKVTIAGLPEGYPLLYKYTLGSWDDVEKGKKCVEIDDRVIDLAYGTTGTMKKSDTVANWRSVLPCTGE